MRRETKEKIGIALIGTGVIAGLGAISVPFYSSVMGIGANEVLMHWTIAFATIAVVKGILGGIAVANNGSPVPLIVAGVSAVALICCLTSGAFMVPTEALAETLGGRILVAAGMDPCSIDLGMVTGVQLGIFVVGAFLAGAAIWGGLKLMKSRDDNEYRRVTTSNSKPNSPRVSLVEAVSPAFTSVNKRQNLYEDADGNKVTLVLNGNTQRTDSGVMVDVYTNRDTGEEFQIVHTDSNGNLFTEMPITVAAGITRNMHLDMPGTRGGYGRGYASGNDGDGLSSDSDD